MLTTGDCIVRLKEAPALVSAGIVLFVASFFMPAVDFGIYTTPGSSAAMQSFHAMFRWDDESLAAMRGYRAGLPSIAESESANSLGDWWFKSAWAINLAFIAAVYLSFRARPRLPLIRILAMLSISWGLVGLFVFAPMPEIRMISRFGLGYWAWLASFALVFVGTFRLQKTANTPANA